MREQMGQYRYLGYLSQEGIEKDVRQHRRRSSACDVTLPGVGKGIGHESRFGCKICGDQWGFCCYMRGSCREEVTLAKFLPLVTG